MPRPTLEERITLRTSSVMLRLLLQASARRNCSVNHIINECLEHEFWRMSGYVLDLYNDLIPLLDAAQGGIVRQPLTDLEAR